MKLTIKTKLMAIVGLMIIGLAGVAYFGRSTANNLGDKLNQISDQHAPMLRASLEMSLAKTGQADDLGSYISSKDQEKLKEWREDAREFEKWADEFGKLDLIDEERTKLKEIQDLHRQYQEKGEEVITLVNTDKVSEANSLSDSSLGKLEDDMFARLDQLKDLNVKEIEQEGKEADKLIAEADFLGWVVPIVVGVLLVGFAIVIIRGIVRPLSQAVAVSQKIAAGDMSERLEPRSEDETGQLLHAMNETIDYLTEMAGVANRIAAGDLSAQVQPKSPQDSFGNSFKQMIANLRNSVGQIGEGSSQVASASAQIAAASEQSKKSSQTLSSSSEEITATIHEMAASIRQVANNSQSQTAAATQTAASITQMVAGLRGVADNTQHLASLTQSADEAARKGQATLEKAGQNLQRIGSSVESAGQTINTLGARAESISKIVETIDDIADQTNLLALNAAIEAARAGEHGLGFAVVADEVRKLAERSARSTKEISELIETIQRESRTAVQQMEQSNQTVKDYISDTSVKDVLSSIITSVEQIVLATQEIEAVTHEQSSAAEQVAKASEDLTRLTHEIGAATEEQSLGAAEVVRAMDQLRGIMQQSVQMASELQTAAESLHRQSGALNGVVGGFNINGHQASAESQYGAPRPGLNGPRAGRNRPSQIGHQALATELVN